MSFVRVHEFSSNFHPNKQLFQVAGAGDQTTDPWITRRDQSSTPTPWGLTLFDLINFFGKSNDQNWTFSSRGQ